jgi:hypothetical protein
MLPSKAKTGRSIPFTRTKEAVQMNRTVCLFLMLGGIALLATGCASTQVGFEDVQENTAMVPRDGKIEFAVNRHGELKEVEYHVDADQVPEKVRNAAAEHFPGSRIVDAEKEYDHGELYWEVTVRKGSETQEIMMTPGGKPYRMEIQVRASEVPSAVLAAADDALPGGRRTSVEKILDGKENLLEYHIKKTVDGMHYKILVTPDGKARKIYREVPAEIEVPMK